MAVRSPILDPDVLNRLAEQGLAHQASTLRLLLRNLAPKGRFVGQEAYRDKVRELADRIGLHDHYLSIAGDPNQVPGDRERANKELLREMELRDEMFSDA